MIESIPSKKPYQQDLVAWCDDTVAKLKAGNFHEIDINSLVEESEGLAGRDRRELKSRLRVLLAHRLKRLYINSPNDYRGWEITIREQRQQLLDLLEQSPSLRNEYSAISPKCWAEASAMIREDYPQTKFPVEWKLSRDIAECANESETLWDEKLVLNLLDSSGGNRRIDPNLSRYNRGMRPAFDKAFWMDLVGDLHHLRSMLCDQLSLSIMERRRC
jgi:hypothetical protein